MIFLENLLLEMKFLKTPCSLFLVHKLPIERLANAIVFAVYIYRNCLHYDVYIYDDFFLKFRKFFLKK